MIIIRKNIKNDNNNKINIIEINKKDRNNIK